MKLKIITWLLLPCFCWAKSLPLARSPYDLQVINRDHYSLSYNKEHNVANWVGYVLDHTKLRNCVQRTNNFRIDPYVEGGSASPLDYYRSGYDRGHLLPAGDMKFSKLAMDETFYMSNMTPQPSKFNRGKWAHLEGLIRAWALKYEQVFVVTGPVIRENLAQIGQTKLISIPTEYFKVILRKSGDTYEGIAFLMSTEVPYYDLAAYALSINELEDYTGIDFLHYLDDDIEEEIESSLNLDSWDFKAKFDYLPCAV